MNNNLTPEEQERAASREEDLAELRKINDEKRTEQLRVIKDKQLSKMKNIEKEKIEKERTKHPTSDLIVIKTYRGKENEAISKFKKDAVSMASTGYSPVNQVWVTGQYSGSSFILALLLCFVLVGFLIFIYMLVVKPEGSLTVTYKRQEKDVPDKASSSLADEIKKLSELHQAGVLTLEEFQTQKQKLLG